MFQIAVGCGEYTDSCLTNHSIRLEYTKEPGSGRLIFFKLNIKMNFNNFPCTNCDFFFPPGNWELVHRACYPSNTIHSECAPNEFHTSSVYSTNTHKKWTLNMFYLPEKTYSRCGISINDIYVF